MKAASNQRRLRNARDHKKAREGVGHEKAREGMKSCEDEERGDTKGESRHEKPPGGIGQEEV